MQKQSIENLVGQILGNYRIERFLGKGRLSAVFLVRHLSAQRIDALVVYLTPSTFSSDAQMRFVVRFQKEAVAITTLSHPHILPVYAHGEIAGYPYLVTPYMTNGSIADVLKQQGRFEHTYISEMFMQIADGLRYAHSRGFIHGTLRPANIVFDEDKKIQISSFGLMHTLQLSGLEAKSRPYSHLLSIAGTFLVAPEYVAPEIVQGQPIDQRSDVYSLGCIFYELLSGQPPFAGTDPLEVAQQHVTHPYTPLRSLCKDIPVVTALVVQQAMERDPQSRFQSVEEFEEAFLQASQGATGYYQVSPALQYQRHQHAIGQDVDDILQNEEAAVQDTPRDGYVSSNWQFMPPIITGRIPSVTASSHTARSKDVYPSYTTPLASQPRSAPSALVGAEQPKVYPVTQSAQIDVFPQGYNPAATRKLSPGASTFMGTPEDVAELAKSYAWWSQSDQVAPIEPLESERLSTKSTQMPASMPVNSVRKSALNMKELDFNSAVQTSSSPAKRKSKVGRRQVIAMLATAGVAAAGTVLALNIPHILAGTQQSTTSSATAHIAPATPQKTVKATPKQAMTTKKQDGHVIAAKSLALNTSLSFTDLKGQPSILIHLPSSHYVAYEKACTHEGVIVNYNPATKMLVCPAHGAIFDPAKGGAVVQGPAQNALPAIKIQVNGDGTISAL